MRSLSSLPLLPLLALLACKGGDDVHVHSGLDDTADTADSSAPELRDPRFDPVAEAMEAELEAMGAPGAAIAVFEGGEVVWAEGFGSRHPERDEPVDATTLFRIGSVTKMMTAAALLKQADAGLIDLDAPVTEVLPELTFALDESWAGTITGNHLITHTAGLFDYGELASGPDDDVLADMMLGFYPNTYWLMSPAGEFWNYSNPNFSLAGLLVETLDGGWYREVMQTEVFEPLGMDRTYFLGTEVLADGDYAAGLGPHWSTGRAGATIEPDSYDSAFMRPAGFAWGSVLELSQFGLFLMDEDQSLLSAASHAAMTTPLVPMQMGMDGQGYGAGVFISEGFYLGNNFHDELMWSHGGDINGYAADLYMLPDRDFGFAILSNASGAHLGEAIYEALSLVVGEPSEAPDRSVDASTFASLTGSYNDPYNVGPVKVLEGEGGLTVTMPLLEEYEVPYEAQLITYLPDTFIFEVQGLQVALTFIRDEDGQGEYMRTRYFVATRDEVEAIAPSPAPSEARVRAWLEAAAVDSPLPVGMPPR